MSGTALKRARLIPFDTGGTKPQDDKAIKFDFNPETLTMKVSTGEAKDKGRRGRQQVQAVGASSATLNFEAIFDTTRPKTNHAVDPDKLNDDTAMDVRIRTKPIADLLAALPTAGGKGGSGGSGGKTDKSPSRVRFQWGNIIFDGVISSHQETFDFFAPSGVPLRSKVALTLTEQNFAYVVDAGDVAKASAAPQPSNARDAAAAAGANSLFDLGSGGLSLGFSADLSLGISLSASASFSAQLGISADFGVSLDAGISLSASAAIDVFGGAALSIGGIGGGGSSGGGDVSQAGLSSLAPSAKPPAGTSPPPSPWAPDGPKAGSSGAELAAVVNGMRAAGAAVAPAGGPNPPAATSPVPVKGSPPPALPRTPMALETVYASDRMVPQSVVGVDRPPRWQVLPGGAFSAPLPARKLCHTGGCGCRACRGH